MNNDDGPRFVPPSTPPAAVSPDPGSWPPPRPDIVNHPSHYNDHPSGVECITVVEHMTFNVGNAVKYLWRAGRKGDALEDLRKARWYIEREIAKREKEGGR